METEVTVATVLLPVFVCAVLLFFTLRKLWSIYAFAAVWMFCTLVWCELLVLNTSAGVGIAAVTAAAAILAVIAAYYVISRPINLISAKLLVSAARNDGTGKPVDAIFLTTELRELLEALETFVNEYDGSSSSCSTVTTPTARSHHEGIVDLDDNVGFYPSRPMPPSKAESNFADEGQGLPAEARGGDPGHHHQHPPHPPQHHHHHHHQQTSGAHKLTKRHHEALKVLRSKVLDLLPFEDPNKLNDDDLLYRFLIARKLDVGLAEEMLRRCHTWRKREGVNTIARRTIDAFPGVHDVSTYFQCAIFGRDTDGHPVLWQRPDTKAVSELISRFGKEKAVILNTYIVERCREVGKLQRSDRFSVVMDLSKIGATAFAGQAGELLRAQIKQTQQVYPECMRRCIIINAPWIFENLFRMVKGLLDPRVQEKIKVGNHHLREFIPASQTPKEFGGTAHVPWEAITVRIYDGPYQATLEP
eukprot:Sspe_Gene.17142::Locus_6074_Transcript_1_2_Confidence_0.667_Length_2278::g.17142::m.17142